MQTRDELYAVLDYLSYERKLDELNARDGKRMNTKRKGARRRKA